MASVYTVIGSFVLGLIVGVICGLSHDIKTNCDDIQEMPKTTPIIN